MRGKKGSGYFRAGYMGRVGASIKKSIDDIYDKNYVIPKANAEIYNSRVFTFRDICKHKYISCNPYCKDCKIKSIVIIRG